MGARHGLALVAGELVAGQAQHVHLHTARHEGDDGLLVARDTVRGFGDWLLAIDGKQKRALRARFGFLSRSLARSRLAYALLRLRRAAIRPNTPRPASRNAAFSGSGTADRGGVALSASTSK